MIALIGAFVETQSRHGWDWTWLVGLAIIWLVVAVSWYFAARKG